MRSKRLWRLATTRLRQDDQREDRQLQAASGALDGARLEELVERAKLHDREARRRLSVEIFRWLRPYFGRALRSTEDVEDATQQVLLRVFESLERYERGSTPFAGWLFTIAHRVAIDHARAAGRSPWLLEPAELTAARDARAAANDAADLWGFEELVAPLTRAQRQALTLTVLHDLTAQQAGRALGHTPASVRQNCKRGLDRLRRAQADQWAPRDSNPDHTA